MVSVEGLLREVLVPAAGVRILRLVHVSLLGVLLEVRHVVRCVPPFEHGISGRRLLLSFPEKVSAERLSQLGGEHVSSGGSGGEGGGEVVLSGGSHDGLRTRPGDFPDGLELIDAAAPLHHQGGLVGVVGGSHGTLASLGSARAMECRGRLGRGVAKPPLPLGGLETKGNERAARDELGSGVYSFEIRLVIDARFATHFIGIFPIRVVLVIIDGALVNVVALGIVILNSARFMSPREVLDGSLLLQAREGTGAGFLKSRGQRTLLLRGTRSSDLEGYGLPRLGQCLPDGEALVFARRARGTAGEGGSDVLPVGHRSGLHY